MEKTKKTYLNIDEYIADQSESIREVLQKVRQTIQKAVPEATETISYNMPTFNLNDKYLIYFSAFKKHFSVYPYTKDMVKKFPELEKYIHLQGTIRFKYSEEVPYDLISKIAKFRVKERGAEY